MDKMKETVKPSMDRTRRQLIIGAGLTPLVVTLHSAKVFGQDLAVGSPSGAAPFSGVIEGSVGPNGQPGDASTEVELYTLIASGNCPENVSNYYGGNGSASGSFSDYSITWDYGPEGTIAWTPDYEKPFVLSFEKYQKACSDVAAAISAINNALSNDVLVNVIAPDVAGVALMPIPDVNNAVGCYELTKMADGKLEDLVVEYNTAANNYNAEMRGVKDFVEIALIQQI